MPLRDGTGPNGMGPRTGRGMGPCGRGMGYGMGRGFAMGRGLGYGMCGCPWCGFVPSEQDEKAMLEEEKKAIEDRLEQLKKDQ